MYRLLYVILFTDTFDIIPECTLLEIKCFQSITLLDPVIDLSCGHVRVIGKAGDYKVLIFINLTFPVLGCLKPLGELIRWHIPVCPYCFSVEIQPSGCLGLVQTLSFGFLNLGVNHPVNHPFFTSQMPL